MLARAGIEMCAFVNVVLLFEKDIMKCLEFTGSVVNSTVKVMEQEELVPDVIDVLPKFMLSVKYGNLKVAMGNELSPEQVVKAPEIWWPANPEKLYTLVMIDPDAPSRNLPVFREWLHYLVGNIPGNVIPKGEVITRYFGSTPPPGSGKHRYTFLLYLQPGLRNYDQERFYDAAPADFSVRRFAEKYGLGQPIAGNFFKSESKLELQDILKIFSS